MWNSVPFVSIAVLCSGFMPVYRPASPSVYRPAPPSGLTYVFFERTMVETVKNRKRIMEQLPEQIIRAQEKIGGTPCWKEDPLQAQTWNV